MLNVLKSTFNFRDKFDYNTFGNAWKVRSEVKYSPPEQVSAPLALARPGRETARFVDPRIVVVRLNVSSDMSLR